MRELLDEYGGALLCAVAGAVCVDLLYGFLSILCGF